MIINKLREEEVFVFGSNAQGFHGAGAAGLAFRGDALNTWREDEHFCKALRAPAGSVARVGKWAVLGVARGFQVGTEGKSYGIVTVTRPGARRSISRREICLQLIELWQFATANPHLVFLMTPVGCGYAGYSPAEMQEVLDYVINKYGAPENIRNLSCYKNTVMVSDT